MLQHGVRVTEKWFCFIEIQSILTSQCLSAKRIHFSSFNNDKTNDLICLKLLLAFFTRRFLTSVQFIHYINRFDLFQNKCWTLYIDVLHWCAFLRSDVSQLSVYGQTRFQHFYLFQNIGGKWSHISYVKLMLNFRDYSFRKQLEEQMILLKHWMIANNISFSIFFNLLH